MISLLDVNVLIALVDPAHAHSSQAHAWFEAEHARQWATCATTENGLVRILGDPRYVGSPGSPTRMIEILETLRSQSNHTFWPETLSIVDAWRGGMLFARSSQITDHYLVALARTYDGRLATLDRRCVQAIPLDWRPFVELIE